MNVLSTKRELQGQLAWIDLRLSEVIKEMPEVMNHEVRSLLTIKLKTEDINAEVRDYFVQKTTE